MLSMKSRRTAVSLKGNESGSAALALAIVSGDVIRTPATFETAQGTETNMPDEPPLVNLSVHLIKTDHNDVDSFLLKRERLDEWPVQFSEGAGQLFIKRPATRIPGWAGFFAGQVERRAFGLITSVSGVLLVQVHDRWFAVTFGPGGRFLVEKTAIEERFGLLVVLNSIPDNQIRSMDKTAFDALATQSRVQTSREASPIEFGLDVERDLVRAVTGTPGDTGLGQRVHGVDSLKASVRIDLADLPDLLARYLAQYRSTNYRRSFPWVDHIAEVKDTVLRENLNEQLLNRIHHDQLETCWLAVPEIVDWDRIDGFRYGWRQKNPKHNDIDLRTWLDELVNTVRTVSSLRDVDLGLLSKRKVFCLDTNGMTINRWSVYKCLNAEIEGDDGNAYLISAGKWYRVGRDFVRGVNEYFVQLPRYGHALPEYCHDSEGSYNESVARADPHTFALLDKQNIPYGGGPSKIEFCDLYTRHADIIHIKRYGGSNVLSHLFSQGTVSGEVFWMQSDFRELVNQRLPESHRIEDCTRRPGRDEYQVVFAIVSKQEGDGLSLPFFSRLNLRAAARRLQAFGYRVSIAKIPVQERFAVAKFYD